MEKSFQKVLNIFYPLFFLQKNKSQDGPCYESQHYYSVQRESSERKGFCIACTQEHHTSCTRGHLQGQFFRAIPMVKAIEL